MLLKEKKPQKHIFLLNLGIYNGCGLLSGKGIQFLHDIFSEVALTFLIECWYTSNILGSCDDWVLVVL